MNSWFRFILRHRWLVLVTCFVLTALAFLPISRAVLYTDIDHMFFEGSPEFARYAERVQQFAPDVFLVVAYEEPAPLSMENLDRLERIHERLTSRPNIARVESVLSAFSLQRLQGYAALARRNPGEAEVLLEELAEDPVLGGLLVSKDSKHVAVLVEFAMDKNLPALVPGIVQVFRDEGIPDEKLHTAGIPALGAESLRLALQNFQVLFGVASVLLLIAVFVLFRRITPALVSTGVAILAVIWTM
ncbi:MAG: hypothetical protein ACYTHM_24525, partial [Planctomycetota bacterium]